MAMWMALGSALNLGGQIAQLRSDPGTTGHRAGVGASLAGSLMGTVGGGGGQGQSGAQAPEGLNAAPAATAGTASIPDVKDARAPQGFAGGTTDIQRIKKGIPPENPDIPHGGTPPPTRWIDGGDRWDGGTRDPWSGHPGGGRGGGGRGGRTGDPYDTTDTGNQYDPDGPDFSRGGGGSVPWFKSAWFKSTYKTLGNMLLQNEQQKKNQQRQNAAEMRQHAQANVGRALATNMKAQGQTQQSQPGWFGQSAAQSRGWMS